MSYLVRNAKRAKHHYADTPRWRIDCETERGPVKADVLSIRATKFRTVEVLSTFCRVNNIEIDYAQEYGEPGYTQPKYGVLLCDWSHIPQSLKDRLEVQGHELEYSDEWTIDYEARTEDDRPISKAYRTQPDSHGWESRVRLVECGWLTPDSDPQEWIHDSMNHDDRPLPSWFNDTELERYGFRLLVGEDKQVGFYPGQNETPDKAGIPSLRAEGYDTVLQITDRGQFDCRYRVWTRREASEDQEGAQYCEFMDSYYTHK